MSGSVVTRRVRELSDEQVEELKRMVEDGATYREAGLAMGVSHSTVYYWLSQREKGFS